MVRQKQNECQMLRELSVQLKELRTTQAVKLEKTLGTEVFRSLEKKEYKLLSEALIWTEKRRMEEYLQNCSENTCQKLLERLTQAASETEIRRIPQVEHVLEIGKTLETEKKWERFRERMLLLFAECTQEEFRKVYQNVLFQEVDAAKEDGGHSHTDVIWRRTKGEMNLQIERMDHMEIHAFWEKLPAMIEEACREQEILWREQREEVQKKDHYLCYSVCRKFRDRLEKTQKIYLAEMISRLKHVFMQFEEANLSREETGAPQREMDVSRREPDVIQRELDVIQRESSVIQRELDVIQRESSVIRREPDVAQKETDMVQRESDVIRREVDAVQKGTDMAQRESDVLQRETDIIQREANTIRETVNKSLGTMEMFFGERVRNLIEKEIVNGGVFQECVRELERECLQHTEELEQEISEMEFRALETYQDTLQVSHLSDLWQRRESQSDSVLNSEDKEQERSNLQKWSNALLTLLAPGYKEAKYKKSENDNLNHKKSEYRKSENKMAEETDDVSRILRKEYATIQKEAWTLEQSQVQASEDRIEKTSPTPTEIEKDRFEIQQFARQLAEQVQGKVPISFTYPENAFRNPAIQEFLQYIRQTDSAEYKELVWKMADTMMTASQMVSMRTFSDTIGEEKWEDGTSSSNISKEFREYGEALLIHPEQREIGTENQKTKDEKWSADEVSMRSIRQQIEDAKEGVKLRRLIDQLNQQIQREEIHLVYQEAQLKTVPVRKLLAKIEQADEKAYREFVTQLANAVLEIQRERQMNDSKTVFQEKADVVFEEDTGRMAESNTQRLQRDEEPSLVHPAQNQIGAGTIRELMEQIRTYEKTRREEQKTEMHHLETRIRRLGIRVPYVEQTIEGMLFGIDSEKGQTQREWIPQFSDRKITRMVLEEAWQYPDREKIRVVREEALQYRDYGTMQTEWEKTPKYSDHGKMATAQGEVEGQTQDRKTLLPMAEEMEMQFAGLEKSSRGRRELETRFVDSPSWQTEQVLQYAASGKNFWQEQQKDALQKQEETMQIKSLQQQLDVRLKEVERKLQRTENTADREVSVRDLADKVKRQLHEELHMERLRRGLT